MNLDSTAAEFNGENRVRALSYKVPKQMIKGFKRADVLNEQNSTGDLAKAAE